MNNCYPGDVMSPVTSLTAASLCNLQRTVSHDGTALTPLPSVDEIPVKGHTFPGSLHHHQHVIIIHVFGVIK